MIHHHVPRWFSGIIRPSGFLAQEFTFLSMGEVPRSIRGWGLFAANTLYLVLFSVSKWSINRFYNMVSTSGKIVDESRSHVLHLCLLVQTNLPHHLTYYQDIVAGVAGLLRWMHINGIQSSASKKESESHRLNMLLSDLHPPRGSSIPLH